MSVIDPEEADFIEKMLTRAPGAKRSRQYKTPLSQRLYELDKVTIRCKWCGDWTHRKTRGTCDHCHDWGYPFVI